MSSIYLFIYLFRGCFVFYFDGCLVFQYSVVCDVIRFEVFFVEFVVSVMQRFGVYYVFLCLLLRKRIKKNEYMYIILSLENE